MSLYKSVLPSKKIRLKVLDFLSFIPDRWMIFFQYFLKTGRILNIKNPVRYTEKVQWYKLNYKDPRMTVCSDKYAVRDFVRSRGLPNILNEVYEIYENESEVDFDKLPKTFVIKSTTGSGNNMLVYDKSKINKVDFKKEVSNWFFRLSKPYGREWGYENIKPRVIVEKMLPKDSRGDLPDYKFFCFDGKVYCLYVMVDFVDNHENGKLAFFDSSFRSMNVYRGEFKKLSHQLEKPENFDLMVKYAETLSKGFPHVRVDFYNIDGDIYFGELTFYNGSGYSVFHPDSFDYRLGDVFVLPEASQ